MVLIPLLCIPISVFAGVNAGGVLVAHDVNLTQSQTDGNQDICGQFPLPADVGGVDARIDGAFAGDPAFFGVYAMFPSGSSPRLLGLTWGIQFSEADVVLSGYATCGDFEMYMDEWPASGTGSSVTWDVAQTSSTVLVYSFCAYVYTATPSLFELTPHPELGGVFGDDTVPSILDPIAGYGAIGFDMDGLVPPEGGYPGACCDRWTGLCEVMPALDCGDNVWRGPDTSCEPGICGTGACCGLQSFYCQDMTREECDAAGGAFLGLETLCATHGVTGCYAGTWGACCDGMNCVVTQAADCPDMWLIDIGCVPNPCQEGLGACCQDINCTVRLESECTGVWFPGIDCRGFPCSPSPGACCTDLECEVAVQEECQSPGSFWIPNRDCYPNPCPSYGACCSGPEACEITSESDCSDLFLAGVPCDPNPCQQYGACCNLQTGACKLLTSDQCGQVTAYPHDFVAGLVSCDPNPCPSPPVPWGACLCPPGDCRELSAEDCRRMRGTFLGAGTSCETDSPEDEPAGPVGACCLETGECMLIPSGECVRLEGFWAREAGSCQPNPCEEALPAETISWGRLKNRYR